MDKLFLIDNHTHGAYGINFNYASYDEMKYLLSQHFERGIMGVCPTLVGESDQNLYKQLKLFKKIKEEQINSPQKECFLIGAHLEGTFLSPKSPGIQDINVFKKPSEVNFKSIAKDCEDIVKIVTIAPEEDQGLIDYLNNKNIKTQAGHTKGDDIENCKGTTHHFNAMPHMHHRNKTIALSGLMGNNYIEIIADLIHLSKDILKLVFKVKDKNKILLISDSLPCAHTDKDIIFCNKKINPKGLDVNGTLAGSNKTLDEICTNLMEEGILNVGEIKQMGFYNQIEYLNLSQKEITRLNYFKTI